MSAGLVGGLIARLRRHHKQNRTRRGVRYVKERERYVKRKLDSLSINLTNFVIFLFVSLNREHLLSIKMKSGVKAIGTAKVNSTSFSWKMYFHLRALPSGSQKCTFKKISKILHIHIFWYIDFYSDWSKNIGP